VVLIERDEVVAALADAVLVIESVPEGLDPKTDTFRRVAGAVPVGTVIASNTSSISLELLDPGGVLKTGQQPAPSHPSVAAL
jgi:3-hydroxyacyl-CoA dehydrogenase